VIFSIFVDQKSALLSLDENPLQIVPQGVALGYTYCGLSGHYGEFAKGFSPLPKSSNFGRKMEKITAPQYSRKCGNNSKRNFVQTAIRTS